MQEHIFFLFKGGGGEERERERGEGNIHWLFPTQSGAPTNGAPICQGRKHSLKEMCKAKSFVLSRPKGNSCFVFCFSHPGLYPGLIWLLCNSGKLPLPGSS